MQNKYNYFKNNTSIFAGIQMVNVELVELFDILNTMVPKEPSS